MSRRESHPPALAMWLLQYLCRGNNNEALTGDLVERFGEGRSNVWFWRQVLIAILVSVSSELRLSSSLICYAIAGTVMLGLFGKAINPVMVPLWVSSRSLQWPLSTATYVLGHAAVLALMVLPILGGLLLRERAFRWGRILRVFWITFPLIAIGHVIMSLWLSILPVGFGQETWMMKAVGVSRIFFTLLISAWLGCGLRLQQPLGKPSGSPR